MTSADMGESLVGAYMRHVESCPIVIYNSFFPDRQGEIDVVAVRPASEGAGREVFLCEVTTHTGGMLLVRNGKNATKQIVTEKLDRLRAFAADTFPDDVHRYQWWSPRVATGATTNFFAELRAEWAEEDRSIEWVINDEYTNCMRTLIESAGQNSSTTNEPAYRLL